MRLSALFFLPALWPVAAAHARTPACLSPGDGLHASGDACISGHVFDVVTVEGGTRFLDLCSPDTPDEHCRVSVVSYGRDRSLVGDLDGLRGKDVSVRGAVQLFSGRYVVILNDQRQLHGGAARFTPDPRLLHGQASEDEANSNARELRVNFHHHGRKLAKE